MTDEPARPSLRFGIFELDGRAGELRRDGVRVRLQDLPVRILEVLVEQPGEMVTREELQGRLWESGTHLDFDNSLNAAISKLREALGDSASHPRFIETVPKRGYRFLADVTAMLPPLPSTPAKEKGHRREAILAGAAAVLAIVLVAVMIRFGFGRQTQAGRGLGSTVRARLAVLPLDDLSAEPDAWFSDGLTEEITTRLGRLAPESLAVIGRTSVMRYRDADPPARDVGEELAVDYLLEGSVRRDGDALRISVQLIETAGETQVWAESYDGRLDAALTVQQEIAEAVAGALTLRLLPRPGGGKDETTVAPPAAVEAYLEGRYLLNRRTRDAMERALTLFENALQLAPGWTAPRRGLADTYALLGAYDYWRPHDAFPKARLNAWQALAEEPENADVYLSVALIRMAYDWQWDEAETAYRKALALDPGSVFAATAYAGFLSSMGRHAEAERMILQAREVDPLSMLVRAEHGWILFFARRFEAAERVLRAAVDLDPNHLVTRDNLKWVHTLQGEDEAAFSDLLEVIRLEGGTPAEVEAFRRRHTPLDWPAVQRGIVADMEARAARAYQSPYDIALEAAQVGDVEAALTWLEKSFEEREIDLISLKADPRLDTLRSDPRFADLVRQVGLPAD